MLRIILAILLPLALAVAAYAAYAYIAKTRAAVPEDVIVPKWPAYAAGALGLLATAIMIFYFEVFSGHPPGTKLEPPRLENGVVVPGGPEE